MRFLAKTLLVTTGLACLGMVPAARAQQLLFDYVGFDYEDPVLVPGTFGGIGNGYVGLGEVPVLASPLVSDQSTYEYTYVLTGLTATSRIVGGSFVVISYTGPGTLTVYEDSRSTGTPFDYGSNPPNPTAPSSFNDGTAILVGAITDFRYVLNTATGSGSYDATFEVVGGTQYGNIPADERNGWTFAGATGNTSSIPPGYAHQVDGQTLLRLPTPVHVGSWGELKRKYR
ncbi:MAG TPA: hypothetical protein VGK89_14645 [Candidatus Eisenbacteria bacterium]|jgi:hypothetical protein